MRPEGLHACRFATGGGRRSARSLLRTALRSSAVRNRRCKAPTASCCKACCEATCFATCFAPPVANHVASQRGSQQASRRHITTFCFMLPLRGNMKQNVDDCFAPPFGGCETSRREAPMIVVRPFGSHNITTLRVDDCRTPRRGVRHHDAKGR
jgi:hypothetical protein